MIRFSKMHRQHPAGLTTSWGLCVGLMLGASCSARANGTAPMQRNPQSNATVTASLSSGPKQSAPDAIEAGDLHLLLRMARERDRPYMTPQPVELDSASAAGLALFKEAPDARCVQATPHFRTAGFELATTTLAGGPAFVVREQPNHRMGGGIYVIRQGSVPRERLVQVPHSFFDVGTLDIGVELANAASARALFVNTVHRYQAGKPRITDDEDREEAPADLAHQDATYFQRMTASALATLPQLQVIQVHGFGDGAVPEGAQAAVVVSPGVAVAGAEEAARVAARLAVLMGRERVFLFPRDTRRFGALTNVQGRLVAKHRQATFLHLELSRTLRTRLRQDADLRRAFIAAVIGAGEKP